MCSGLFAVSTAENKHKTPADYSKITEVNIKKQKQTFFSFHRNLYQNGGSFIAESVFLIVSDTSLSLMLGQSHKTNHESLQLNGGYHQAKMTVKRVPDLAVVVVLAFSLHVRNLREGVRNHSPFMLSFWSLAEISSHVILLLEARISPQKLRELR